MVKLSRKPTESDDPILIVGAGPTGLVMAIELARRRVPFRLIDSKRGPTQTSRSFTLHARTMEMFEHMGFVSRFIDSGVKSRGFLFSFAGKAEQPSLDFSGLATRYPYIHISSQRETEQELRDHLELAYDVRPEWGVAVAGLTPHEHDYSVNLARKDDGREEVVRPKWIVGCDGVHSVVRTASGLGFEGENYEGMIMQMMDGPLHGLKESEEWVHYRMAKDSFLLFARLPGGNYRVLISAMGDSGDPATPPREIFQGFVDKHLTGVRVGEPEWATKWTIWKRLATAYRKHNAFLVGDAAHVHSPSGGQGMNIGMQDSFNLAWKLAMVSRGEAKPTLLDTFEPERKPIGAQAIAGTDAMHDIIMAHGHNIEDRLELTRKPGWHDETVRRISGLSYNYCDATPLRGGVTALGGIQPGERVPDFQLFNRRRLFDYLRHPRLTLIVVRATSGDSDDCLRLCERFDKRFAGLAKCLLVANEKLASDGQRDVIIDQTGEFHRAFRIRESSVFAVRPDGYLAVSCLLRESEIVFAYFEEYFG